MTKITYTPQLGKALVIQGPQGSGKARLATQISQKRGKFINLEFGQNFKSALKTALNEQPATLIIDGNPNPSELADIKCIVTNHRLDLRPPFSDKKISVTAPFVIICNQSKADWISPKDTRRFDVISLKSAADTGALKGTP